MALPTIREVLVLAALSAAASSGAAQRRPSPADTTALLEHARRLHREVPMIDTHNDLPEMIQCESLREALLTSLRSWRPSS